MPRPPSAGGNGWSATGCARAEERRATEVDVAVHAPDRVLGLGRPIYVRIS